MARTRLVFNFLKVIDYFTHFSSYEEDPQEATHQEKWSDMLVVPNFYSGFEDHIYQKETIFGSYAEDIVSALRIQLPDTTSKHFCQF